MASPPRPVLIHYHIFKNAGMSVDAALESSFGPRWAVFEGQHAHDIQAADRLRAFLLARPDVEAVSSHLARPPLPWESCLPIVFLRHPILRAQSVYEFTRRDASQPFHAEARDNELAGYVRWALDGGRGGVVIRDYQVVHLSDASFRAPDILDARATIGDLAEACDLLTRWGLVGIVESYAESARLYQSAYAGRLPQLRFAVNWRNRTIAHEAPPEERVESIRAQLGQALFDELLGNNALDLKLYEHGQRLFRQACSTHAVVGIRGPDSGNSSPR
jgi:hypothetical protein